MINMIDNTVYEVARILDVEIISIPEQLASWLDTYRVNDAGNIHILKHYHDLPVDHCDKSVMESWVMSDHFLSSHLQYPWKLERYEIRDSEAWALFPLVRGNVVKKNSATLGGHQFGRVQRKLIQLTEQRAYTRPMYLLDEYARQLADNPWHLNSEKLAECLMAMKRLIKMWKDMNLTQEPVLVLQPAEQELFIIEGGKLIPRETSLCGMGYPEVDLAAMLFDMTDADTITSFLKAYLDNGGIQFSLFAMALSAYVVALHRALRSPHQYPDTFLNDFNTPILENNLPQVPFLKHAYFFFSSGF